MSSIRFSHDISYDLVSFDTPSENKYVDDISHNRHVQRSLLSTLRPPRTSEGADRSMYQSVNRPSRKMEFDDFKTKSITFDKDMTSMKSLKNIMSFKKSDTIKDFKEFFNDVRTLIIY
jgi:hypothetical protein